MRPLIWAGLVLIGGAIAGTSMVERLAQQTQNGAVRVEPGTALHAEAPPSRSETGAALSHDLRLAADSRGHFQADPQVNGLAMPMLVDTGASVVALRESDARAAGLQVDRDRPPYRLSTANGVVEAYGATIREFRLGPIILHDVEAVVMPDEQLGKNLLGMSVLRRLHGFEVRDGALWLRG
ncbi:MAG: TIGR02281 family clan AA aspartic protease [Salinarimonas sp.]|nr:TIGR02281 family clan AA aspartic protease [Salinarimonas sp.]